MQNSHHIDYQSRRTSTSVSQTIALARLTDEQPSGSCLTPERPMLQYGELLGCSDAFKKMVRLLTRLEQSTVNVLIEGESGTGKELVARAIHDHSKVRRGPFVAVNCGALESSLLKSELFGHTRGAFTGAVQQRAGAFAAAEGGTLFLDEIGELPLDLQPVLLRVIEQRAVRGLGSDRERPINVRLLFATNRELRREVAQGRFREDLFYRLNVVRCAVTPLRQRSEDVVLLARHFAEKLGVDLEQGFWSGVADYHWPGNVRELRNVVEAFAVVGLVTLAPSPNPDELDSVLQEYADPGAEYGEQKARLLELFARAYVGKILQRHGGNISQAARVAGLERSYLSKLARRLGVIE